MAAITHPRRLNNQEVAQKIKQWFEQKGFETRIVEQSGLYAIKARKSSSFRAVLGADRALEVTINTVGEETHVDVRQGSWKTNAISNVAWLVATGGMNLAISGWSVVVQKELEGYIRDLLMTLSGATVTTLQNEQTYQQPFSSTNSVSSERNVTPPANSSQSSLHTPEHIQSVNLSTSKKSSSLLINIVVKFLFGFGILVMPYIFAWFLLKKGYSTSIRILGFVWMIIVIGFYYYDSHKSPEEKVADSAALEQKQTNTVAYKLNDHENNLLSMLLKDDAQTFANGGGSLLSDGLGFLTVSAVDVAKVYSENQVAGDQKYKNKNLLLSGVIVMIGSGLGDEPYITLHGGNQFNPPQAHFKDGNEKRIATLKKGQKVGLVCRGNGSIVGAPMFSECQFADTYINEEANKLISDIDYFLQGEKPKSNLVAQLPIAAIAVAKNIPENSPCYSDVKQCGKAIESISDFKSKLNAVAAELKARGLQVPDLKFK